MKLEMLFDLIEKENIAVEYMDFSPTIQGIYYKADGCLPIIGINENIVSNRKLFTCVLAEELGHHFTSTGDSTTECYSFVDKINLGKTELAALKWAAEYLLPLDEIVGAIKKGIKNIEELSDFLGVTDEFLLEGFRFMAKKQSFIKIQEDLFIALTNLPNIYLFKGFYEDERNSNKLVAEGKTDYSI
ncbi:MAG: ImmA/IrrE family metallo-endopeptidase [Natronincolaceae bacterium]|jgi:Zn-dependent peptidase ImmA (M78 family)|nr:ImmA/IrrE family metallo-endopeptidase [Bacillota bacterium]NLK91325.1 ImmA/IrrE family metallo-endopeptidase [Clostridiales bacterium]